MSRLPVVAVVGRPNVGKSTLVNRIVGGRQAVVEEMPGVTRDRREFTADWAGAAFLVVDTGGWDLRPGAAFSEEIREQAQAAVAAADVVVFVTDATTGLTDDDQGVVDILRSAQVPVLLAANKIDDESRARLIDDFWTLGLGQPHPVSAFHGVGVGDLLDAIIAVLPEGPEDRPEDDVPNLAIIGRPNVGKSTLLNRLLGEERVIVSERPGTTRDPIDVVVTLEGHHYRLIDTAGIRRRPQITEDADFYAVLRAREVLARADVAMLVVDAAEGVTHQDQRIAEEVVEAGAGLVLVVNKWDLVDDESRRRIETDLSDRLRFISWAPMVRISAKTGSRTGRLPAAVEAVIENRLTRIPTGVLNRHVSDWTNGHPPPTRRGRRPRIRYVVQAGVAPPTYVVFVTGGELGPDYLRFLEGRIRGVADFTGTPIHVVTRARDR
ncbi:MAG: ribosome biogenesis GTPase Der [Acidimicrobiia bacterium]|nr:ribosome biogenesis GTPase Der [Acidimicrobiia bacterium]MDH5293274.1 ribosome biogenesis GTPase Der [Acidimicrobiia bacterium]